jgi:hypothetical protein
MKEEKAEAIASGAMLPSKVVSEQIKGRRRLIVIWICMFPLTMSFPFWLPIVSGVSLGRVGDFMTALGSFLMLSLICWIQLKKMPNQSTDPTLSSGTPAARQPARHP